MAQVRPAWHRSRLREPGACGCPGSSSWEGFLEVTTLRLEERVGVIETKVDSATQRSPTGRGIPGSAVSQGITVKEGGVKGWSHTGRWLLLL